MLRNLQFFNKKGENLNLYFDTIRNIYKGSYKIGSSTNSSIGTDLIESEQIYILEEVYNGNELVYSLPHTNNLVSLELESKFLHNDEYERFFFYTINKENVINDLYEPSETFFINKSIEHISTLEYSNDIVNINGKDYTQTTNEIIDPLSINIGFKSSESGSYFNTLQIFYNSQLIAEINLFVDVIEEDYRLTMLLDNLGENINNSDYYLFDSTNINEDYVDYNLINKKRKELLLEFNNIFPYLGSYKALINIIKFFGYENLRLKEYWKNIDLNSEHFNTFKSIEIKDVFTNIDANINDNNINLPSNIYKKTSKFGLYYDITENSGEYDEDGLPIVIESFSYSQEDILIKLYGLKEKLSKYFLPLNASIIDIVGEAMYYSKIDLNVWIDTNRIDEVSVGIDASFESSKTFGFIEDLRHLYWVGTKIGNDLLVNGDTNLKVREFEISNTFHYNTIRIYDTVTNNGTTILCEYNNTDVDNTLLLYSKLKELSDDNIAPFNNYHIDINDNKILFVERIETNSNLDFDVTQGRFASGIPSININDYFNGNLSVNQFYNAYLGYFNNSKWNIDDLKNRENIIVGLPITLKNTSFTVTWDELNVTWDNIDEDNIYSKFESSSDNGFPSLIYDNANHVDIMSWDNIGNSNVYEIEWEIYNIDKSFISTFRGHINEYNDLFIVLPYVGTYSVIMRLYDLYGKVTEISKTDYITVEQKRGNFIAWNLNDSYDATWNDLDNSWNDTNFIWDLPFKDSNSEEVKKKLDLHYSTFDNVEFYQNLIKQDIEQNSYSDLGNAYRWNNLDNITWDDLENKHWDSLSSAYTKFHITDIDPINSSIITIKNEVGDILEEYVFTPTNISTNVYIDFINQLSSLSLTDYPILTSFIFDYIQIKNEFYDNIDTIILVSKTVSKSSRYIFDTTNLNCSELSYINGFGALGNTPTSFTIYEVLGNNSSNDVRITIDGITHIVSQGITTLEELCNELNSSIFNDIWEFNLVRVASTDLDTPTYDIKILAYKKDFIEYDECHISYLNIIGTTFGRSIYTNLGWDNLNVIIDSSELKVGTQVHFTYDISKLPSFSHPIWVIKDVNNNIIFEYKNRYLSYLFVNKDEYSVELTLSDSNNNTTTVYKNSLITIV